MINKEKLELKRIWSINAISKLGGAAKLSRLLGYDGTNGMRRVSNWSRRGIPASVILDRQDIFSPLM